jgi:hypothetical protein
MMHLPSIRDSKPSDLYLGLIVLALVLASLIGPVSARAVVHATNVLDGPANNILEVDGSAMAPDGSGGVVYRKEMEGVAHLFVVRFQKGVWDTPVQVDTEDPYGTSQSASQPAIAAGEGGELLVVWVQPRNVSPHNVTEYALMSASLQPGASAFGREITIDPNVGEPRTADIRGVEPKLAMAPDGAAYVVYRATTDDCGLGDEGNPEEAKCRPGSSDKVVSVHVARFNYLTWSSLGTINRAPQIAMRTPTSENAPAIGIGLNGDGVVAWQEPDAGDVARIWVRRLFGTVKGNVLEASPEALSGKAVTSDADAPLLAVGPYGEARIAYRIQGGQGSAVATTQLFLNWLLSETAPHGAQLQGAASIGTQQEGLGPPGVSIDPQGNFRLSWTADGAVNELEGDTRTHGPQIPIGSAVGPTSTTINPAGGGTTAWIGPPGTAPAVQVREDYGQGAFQAAQLAGDLPGPASGLALGGDGQGDALIAFMQGPVGRSEVVGDFVQAPPAKFIVNGPLNWIRSGSATITWEPAFDAVAGVSYTVYVDGNARVKGLSGLSVHLSAVGLGDGIHHVQVLATDTSGQRTMSVRNELKVDANPPSVTVRLIDHSRAARVTVADSASGVATAATLISFGDGVRAHGRTRVRHVYAHAGLYTIVAQVRDRVGNHATVRLRVRVA